MRGLYVIKGLYLLQGRICGTGVKNLAQFAVKCSGSAHFLVPNSRIDKYRQKLEDFGFSRSQAMNAVCSEPEILNIKLENIANCFLKWYTFKMPDAVLMRSLASCPSLLLLSEEEVDKRCRELLTIFTQNDLIKLLKTCPEVFLHNFGVTMKKVQYLVHCMGVEQKSIVKAEALKHDLKFISLRHSFLIAAGKYKKPGKKTVSNPPLAKILHKDVRTFLKVTSCTEEEYDVFCDIYEKFLGESDEDDSESEGEDDGD